MKPIANQENALNLLLKKNESKILKELVLANNEKNLCLSKISSLKDKLNNNPSPSNINGTFDIVSLSNYHNFRNSIEKSIEQLELELKSIDNKLVVIKQDLSKINYKQSLFANYFHKIKQENDRLKEKKSDAAIHDQYSNLTNFTNIQKQ